MGIAIGLSLISLAIRPCHAASVAYPDLGPVPPGVSFTNIVESSAAGPVPLFGEPAAFPIGLDFDPAGFVATAKGGASDDTVGNLKFIVVVDVNFQGIDSISLFEAGDYTLAGVGTAATQATAEITLHATVTQINGVNVAPIGLAPANGSVGFDLAANPGVVQPWSSSLLLDVAAQLAPGQRATKVVIGIENKLQAVSEAASLAFLAKTDFRIGAMPSAITQPDPSAPEPAALLLLLSGAIGLAPIVRRRAI